MKKSIILPIMVCACISLSAQYPDLPGPGGNFNLQTLPTGSYIIAMDNQNQGSGAGTFTAIINNRAFNWVAGNPVLTAVTNTTGILVGMSVTGHSAIPAGATVTAITATTVTISIAPLSTQNNRDIDFGNVVYNGANFNLRAYGLLVHLLNNNIKLKWIIKPGKTKDAVDFSVSASLVKPVAGATATRGFASGPFVIFQPDTAGVAALVQSFNGTASADDVKLYKSTADVSVDVRYDYFFNGKVWKPKAAIMDDGGHSQIHEEYMQNASVPISNYEVATSPGLVIDCYTFASEPHNTHAPNSVIQAISTFVNFGGNFLAQCAAVRTYELSTLARFQSTNGFDNSNENGDPAAVSYTNSDLSYFQINGYFGMADEDGSLKTWVIPQAPVNPPKNHFHYYTSGTDNGRNYTNASVAKLVPTNQMGGLVFYLGSHSYDGSADYDINGQRMYMNAFLTPTNPQGSLQSAAVMQCPSVPGNPVVVNTGSSAGPAAAYPLRFNLYDDRSPIGTFGPEDIQRGNTVTMTAPNTYQGASAITAPYPTVQTNYLIVVRPALACFSPRILQALCSPILSVNYTTFAANRSSSMVNLTWTTSSEQNSRGFHIERMIGNGSWETVGYTSSRSIGGSSADALNYQFTDLNNSYLVSQYRLRQVDLDNNFRYSEIRIVKGLEGKSGMVVYPNPSNGTLHVFFDEVNVKRDISLVDMSGRVIKQMKGVTATNVQIDDLKTGMYLLRTFVPATGELDVEKIIVNK